MKNNSLLLIVILLTAISVLSSVLLSQQLSTTTIIGQATSSMNGNISLKLESFASIYINDSTINFGNCKVNSTKNYSLYDSSQSNLVGDNVLCQNSTLPDKLIIENDGTVSLNITVKTNQLSSQAFNDSQSWVAFKGENDPSRPGCSGVLQTNYTNFTQTNTAYPFCSKLQFIDSNDRLNFYTEVYVTNESSGSLNTTIIFEGVAV